MLLPLFVIFLLAEILIYSLVVYNLHLIRKHQFPAFFQANLAAVSAWLIATMMKLIINDPRPYLLDQVDALIPNPPSDGSFPSGHAAVAFAYAFSLLPHNPKAGFIFLAIATAVAAGRIVAYIHTPLDILGGILLATIISIITYYGYQYFVRKSKSN